MRLKIVSSCATILEGRWIKLLFVSIKELEFRYHRILWSIIFADQLEIFLLAVKLFGEQLFGRPTPAPCWRGPNVSMQPLD